MTISCLGYIIFSSTNLDDWRQFGEQVVGAMNVAQDDNSVALKIDEQPFRILVEPGDADHVIALGWEMAGKEEFSALQETLTAQGFAIRNGSDSEAENRAVTAFFTTFDPASNPLEFYYGRTLDQTAFLSPVGVKSFVTGDMGLGHVVVPGGEDMEGTHAFYTTVLGLGDSDDLNMQLPGENGPKIRVRFLHAANARHHSLAIASLPSPSGVIHAMLEMEDVDDVGRCHDRVLAAERPLMASLGRHCNDNMLSFYVVGPGGIPFEIGCEGLQVDWTDFEPTKSSVPDHWGHAYQVPA
jgi:3,4-dihydroxy-9,10-secoandrosta-1,3,5(10)-triene-9,17-dione 4,5-dioxygenase